MNFQAAQAYCEDDLDVIRTGKPNRKDRPFIFQFQEISSVIINLTKMVKSKRGKNTNCELKKI